MMSNADVRKLAVELKGWLIEEGDPFRGDDWNMFQVIDAYMRLVREDDDDPADFDWLCGQCDRESGEDWVVWVCGSVTFTCKDVAVDPGEWETVADDWQVEGEKLPHLLIPKTRGQFRHLCELANGVQPGVRS